MDEHMGPATPAHRWGHCHHDPAKNGNLCGAPALWHLWVGEHDDPDAFTTYTCADHLPIALACLHITDSHAVADTCLAAVQGGRFWRFSDATSEGFCYDPDEDLAAQACVSKSTETVLTG